jgi:hypothetical protein
MPLSKRYLTPLLAIVAIHRQSMRKATMSTQSRTGPIRTELAWSFQKADELEVAISFDSQIKNIQISCIETRITNQVD